MGVSPIMVVEDSDDDLFFFQRAFAKAGWEHPLVVARDGQEAVERFRSTPEADAPALVLLDLKLPKLNGHEVLQAIRQSDPARKTIVICLTGSHEPADRRRAYEQGANGYLIKPSRMEDVEQLLRSIKGFWVDHNISPRSSLTPRALRN